jgi:hypothetical protein
LGKFNRATVSGMLTRGVIYNIFATFVSDRLNLKYSLNITQFELRLSAEWAGETFRFHRPIQLIPELLDQRSTGDSGQQIAGVGTLWRIENLVRRALLDDLAAFHHADVVCDLADHSQVVGNEQVGETHFAL